METFVWLLFGFSLITSLITEAIKKVVDDKDHLAYNIMNLIVALIVGCGGCFAYYIIENIDITLRTSLYAVLMGFVSCIASQVGYDKVKQTIDQIMGNKEIIEDEEVNE